MFLGVAVCLFIWAAIRDFLTWKIPNKTVLSLIAAYVAFAAASFASGPPLADAIYLPSAIGSAALLLAVGIALWMFKMFGAGDAKLLAPIGLFVGWIHLPLFAMNLILFGILALLVIKMPLPAEFGATSAGMRLNEIRATGKVPYGVVMVLALIPALWTKYLDAVPTPM